MEDYEKLYKNSLGRGRIFRDHLLETGDKGIAREIEYIFPALAESKDEKVRKNCIHFLELQKSHHASTVEIEECITWLEKQGNIDLEFFENSENEKREFVGYGFLKCKGDFLSFKEGENYWLEYVGKDNYNVRSDNLLGQTFHITPQQLYTVFRPTTWLEKQGQTFTKKDVDDAYLKGVFDTKQGKHDARYKYFEEIIAADDIYQMSMNDAMVNEAKEKAAKALSKLCIGKLLGFEKQGEQKPTSDTRYEVGANGSLSVNGKPFDYEKATITQKDFVPEQELKKVEDEIEIPFGAKDSELQEVTYYIPKGFHAEIDDDNVVIKKGEKPAAWSDEDEERIKNTLSVLDVQVCWDGATGKKGNPYQKEIDWLKSIKVRIIWKPSKKQMETLEYYMHTLLATEHKEVLFGLYNDLKKL